MFQDITLIPTNENISEISHDTVNNSLSNVYNQLWLYYQNTYCSSYFATRTPLRAVQDLSSYIDGMNCEENSMKTLECEYARNAGNIHHISKSEDFTKVIGLVINIDSEHHFIQEDWGDLVFLDGAAEALKREPRTFFKIFHRADNPNLLFAWTNRSLKPEQYYKLKVLQNKLNKDNLEHFNEYTEKIYKAFESQDLNKVNTAFREFFNSPYIKEKEYQSFAKLFTSRSESSIHRLESKLRQAYENIKSYENYIANEARKIESLNNQMYAIIYHKKSEEDIKELHKYITKHRHITNMKINSYDIELTFKAPIVYYTDYAIEKIDKNYTRKSIEHKILQLFLDRKYELYTECIVQFVPDNFNIEPRYRSSGDQELIGQPHIDQYGCLGNHRDGVEESAEAEDYIGAIEQINQAVMNMNFYDACVANYLLRALKEYDTYDVKHTWMEKETGEMVTTAEAIRRSYPDEEA